jgi:predicted dehydrogenase
MADEANGANGTLATGGLLSYQAGSVPYNASGWTMEAYGTEGTLVASAAALPQITPIVLSGARGEDLLAPLDVPDRLSSVVAVPDGPGRNIARSQSHMAEAIIDGGAGEPDFGRALEVHRLLDAVTSSDERRALGVGS